MTHYVQRVIGFKLVCIIFSVCLCTCVCKRSMPLNMCGSQRPNLQESILSFYHVGPWIQFSSAGLLAGAFPVGATSVAHFQAWNTSLNWILKIIYFSAATSDVSVVIWRYFPPGLCVLCLFNNYSTDTSQVLTEHHVLFVKQNDKNSVFFVWSNKNAQSLDHF